MVWYGLLCRWPHVFWSSMLGWYWSWLTEWCGTKTSRQWFCVFLTFLCLLYMDCDRFDVWCVVLFVVIVYFPCWQCWCAVAFVPNIIARLLLAFIIYLVGCIHLLHRRDVVALGHGFPWRCRIWLFDSLIILSLWVAFVVLVILNVAKSIDSFRCR